MNDPLKDSFKSFFMVSKSLRLKRTGLYLIVDDDPDMIVLLGAILQEHGHRYVKAFTVQEAKEKIEEVGIGNIKCAVIDYFITPDCGLELVDWIRERTIDIPLFILTASEEVVEVLSKERPYLTPISKSESFDPFLG